MLTKETVDIIAPEHGRTSCSDSDLANAYGGWYKKYDPDTGRKVIHYPRCTRCYLLEHVGEDMGKLEFAVRVTLEWREN